MPETVISKYPFVLATVATRKEGLTREQFRNHNETYYVPLMKKCAGAAHPLTWTRRYHVDEGEGPAGVPRVLFGSLHGFDDFDCFGEMTFADELHCQQFITLMHSEAGIPCLEEEAKFADPSKTKLIVMRRDVSIGERAQVQKFA